MPARILGSLLVAVTAILALLLAWPELAGLQDQWVFAHVVALRGLAAVVGGVLAIVFLLLVAVRPVRRLAIAMCLVLLAFSLGNVGILVARGFGGSSGQPAADRITVLSWNTLGEVPGASVIAALALREEADVVVLPETTDPLGEEVAIAMREGGRRMWVHTKAFDDVAKARSTTLLISPELGDYEVVNSDLPGPPGNTNTLPSVVAAPVDGNGPTIVAVHAVAPIRWELRNWRSDLDWIAAQCAGGDVIMAGDFNATIDHFAGRGTNGGVLGDCRDAASAAGAAAVGTWPTSLPAALGSPIDHVLATPGWRVDSFEVVQSLDDAGSDHRPVLARLSRTP